MKPRALNRKMRVDVVGPFPVGGPSTPTPANFAGP